MNRSDFILTGGYPLKAERLQELQAAYSIFNALGALAGNLTIISGCTLAGSNVGNGFVYINGELLDFRQAAVTPTSTVVIIEEAVNRGFKNGIVKQVHTIRYATFGTDETSWLWTDFKRVDAMSVMMARLDVMEKKTAVFQSGGGMLLWNKPANEIPTGWQEVVDWRGRMPVGYDANQSEFNLMGKTGGAKNKTLSIAELPEHDFKLFSIGEGAAGLTKTYVKSTESAVVNSYGTGWGNDSYVVRGSTTPATLGKSSKVGSGQQFSILNPYRVVLFIEFIG